MGRQSTMCHSLSLGLSRWCTPGKGSVAGGAAEPESRSVGLEKREHRGCGMQSGCKAGKRSSFRAFNHSKVSFFFFLILCATKSWCSVSRKEVIQSKKDTSGCNVENELEDSKSLLPVWRFLQYFRRDAGILI